MSRVKQKMDELHHAARAGADQAVAADDDVDPYANEVYVLDDDSALLPTRWVAPECLSLDKKRFSEKSDV